MNNNSSRQGRNSASLEQRNPHQLKEEGQSALWEMELRP